MKKITKTQSRFLAEHEIIQSLREYIAFKWWWDGCEFSTQMIIRDHIQQAIKKHERRIR